jgi:hypothetical protein
LKNANNRRDLREMKKAITKTCEHLFAAGITPYIFVFAIMASVAGGIMATARVFAPEYIRFDMFVYLTVNVVVYTLVICAIIAAIIVCLKFMADILESFKGPTRQ